MDYDYLVVGQGLAGTVLGYTLQQKGKSVYFIDKGLNHSSSMVAAGIFNPVTGKRMVKTWKADTLFPFLFPFYKQFEQDYNIRILYDIPAYKPFNNTEEQNYWYSRSTGDAISAYIHIDPYDPAIGNIIHNDLGGMEILYSGYVDVSAFINVYRDHLVKQNLLSNDYFRYEQLYIEDDQVNYSGLTAGKVIFCEGYQAAWNPWFKQLPYVSVKGELCLIEMDVPRPSHIINKNVFLIPLDYKTFKAGATYDWEFLDAIPSNKGKALLERELNFMLKPAYTVIDQKAGVRPVFKDRRPCIGLHPEYPQLGIFNGMGSKGVSLAPYFADHFYTCLERNEDPEKEVNVRRFFN